MTAPTTDVTATTEFLELDEWDKLLIIACAALFLLIVVVCIVCKVYPGCCLYKHCPFRAKYKEKPGIEISEEATYYGSTLREKAPEYSTDKVQPGDEKWLPLRILDDGGKEWSELDDDVIELPKKKEVHRHHSGTSSSTNSSDEGTSPISAIPSAFRGGHIDFSLNFDNNNEHIIVILKSCKDLSTVHGNADQYIRIRLVKSTRLMSIIDRHPDGGVELKSRIHKDNTDIKLQEKFEIPLKLSDVKHHTLKLQLVDFDRFSRHVLSGEIVLPLAKTDLVKCLGEEQEFSVELSPSAEVKLGEVYVALSYLPIAEKLSVTIVRARGLRMEKRKQSKDVYAKAILMADGVQLRKVKTSVIRNSANPSFNECFTFDVPREEITNAYILVTLVHEDLQQEAERARPDTIGRVYLGIMFEGEQQDQWIEMMQHPRKQIACWQKLH